MPGDEFSQINRLSVNTYYVSGKGGYSLVGVVKHVMLRKKATHVFVCSCKNGILYESIVSDPLKILFLIRRRSVQGNSDPCSHCPGVYRWKSFVNELN